MIVDRFSYILDACRGKRVLHLGCTDWPFTEGKLTSDALLHSHIGRVATSLVGIDADRAGVNRLIELGFSEVYVDNVEEFSHPKVRGREFDLIVAGEIIEHLENPGLFLRAVKQIMAGRTDLLITTINAYCFHRIIFYLLGKELVHEDHNYYFSPKVLHRLVTRCGLEVIDLRYYPVGKEIRSVNPRRIVWLDDIGRLIFPRASDGLVLKARLSRSAEDERKSV